MNRRTSFLVLALSLAGSAAWAQAQPPKPAPPSRPVPAPARKNTQLATHMPTHKVRETSPGLLKQAKITPEAAEQTALGAVPGGRVWSRMIRKEKTSLVYVFNIRTSGKEGYDRVTVDANTGALASNTHHNGSAKHGTAMKKP